MAIVINGSGTVTGLAVGGLPDGTVDADTLAANSVVTGKITDGTILNADINASADIASSKFADDNIIYAVTTDFGSGQFQSATTNTTVYSDTVITVPSVPAGGKILAIFNGGFGESSSGYGNYWGFDINGTAYASLIRATQSHLDSNTMQKTVTLSSAATNVVVKIVSTHSGASYQEFRLGGASPATLSVFVIK
jgi:hypothetical protein